MSIAASLPTRAARPSPGRTQPDRKSRPNFIRALTTWLRQNPAADKITETDHPHASRRECPLSVELLTRSLRSDNCVLSQSPCQSAQLSGQSTGVLTLAYFGLYLTLRELVGAQVTNVITLLITAVANAAADRRLTFRMTGQEGLPKHHLGGLVASAVGVRLTSGSLWVLAWLAPGSGRAAEVAVLVLSNLVATAVRFLTLQLVRRKDEVPDVDETPSIRIDVPS
jgi:putative flippase GtrA